ATTGRRFTREVKVWSSGSWEAVLLKATWPDDHPPDDATVGAILHGVRRFETGAGAADVTRRSAPHRVLLHKLWSRMAERDHRTVLKALHLLHRILQELPPADEAVLRKFLSKMRRERAKKTGGPYFDPDVLCDVD
ncbi:unnamed protein product, partial [Phaeothamnion confervicola]